MQSEIESILKKLKELVFLANTDFPHERVILLIHAINLCENLKCTGLLEDDPVENYIIPPNWDKSIDNIYSLRYMNDTKEVFYFKFIHAAEANVIEINAVSSVKTDTIISDEIPNISMYKSLEETSLLTSFIKNYQKKIIAQLFKKPQKKPEETKKNNENIVRQNPNDFFLNRQRNVDPSPFVPTFGDYGSSDLRPVPLGGLNTGGSLLGPNNPIFSNRAPNLMNPINGPPGPNIRFDPFGPDDINGSFPGFDGAMPQNPRFGNGQGFGGGGNNFFF